MLKKENLKDVQDVLPFKTFIAAWNLPSCVAISYSKNGLYMLVSLAVVEYLKNCNFSILFLMYR